MPKPICSRPSRVSSKRRHTRRGFSLWHIVPCLVPGLLPAAVVAAGTHGGTPALSASRRSIDFGKPPISSMRADQTLASRVVSLKVPPFGDFGFLRGTTSLAPATLEVTGHGAVRLPAPQKHATSPAAPRSAEVFHRQAISAQPTDLVLDSTLIKARPVPFTSNTFTITPDLGRSVSGNLFYSFDSFSLSAGQTANFTGTPANPVHNLLVRVTGGQTSNIDGQLACTFPGASFIFMNPGGITFNSKASLDMPGSFGVTTADYVQFTDNTRFQADSPAISPLHLLGSGSRAAAGRLPASHSTGRCSRAR